jgi:CheY-like chemotaxis protein
MVIVVLLIYFGGELKRFVKAATEIRFKIGGVEGTISRQQLKSAAALGAAVATREVDGSSAEGALSEADLRRIANTVSQTMARGTPRIAPGSAVLWVDDRPNNNRYERAALEVLGIDFTISTSTEDALDEIGSHRYDLIISDMGRPGDPQAGYTLLEELRRRHLDVPFIIYAGSDRPEHKALARTKGAFGSTNNPQELFQLVVAALNATGSM